VNSTNTSIVLANIDAAVAEATATNQNKHIPHAQAFIAKIIDVDPIGKKQAELQKCRTTAELTLDYLESGGSTCVTAPLMAKVRSLASYFESMAPRNEFEQNVVRHTLESLRIGRVEPRSAAFVAWAGKIYKDRMVAEAAVAEAKNTPVGKAAFTAVYQGLRQVATSYGNKAVHTFVTTCGKRLEWWTDFRSIDFDENGNLINAPEHYEVDLKCRIKGSSVWQGRLTYKITHATWVETKAAPAPKAPTAAAAPKAAPAIAPEPLPF
jgi:hypothetical protein